jgi:tRNA/rRNA methyltransferase
LPVELVFVQDFATKDDALIIERQIKGWSRKKKAALLAKDWNKIKLLSKKNFNIKK